jgi:hypothetical protein
MGKFGFLSVVILISLCSCDSLEKFESAARRIRSGDTLQVTIDRREAAEETGPPAVVGLGAGELAAVFSSRDSSSERKIRVFASLSADGGREWRKPWPVLESLASFESPGLCPLRDGSVLLTFAWTPGPASPAGGFLTSLSRDRAASFSPPKFIPVPGAETVRPCKRPIVTEDGAVLLPLAVRTADGRHGVRLARSPDRGDTWFFSQPFGRDTVREAAFRGAVAVRLADRTIYCLIDGPAGDPFLYASRSADNGRTWNRPWNTGIEGSDPDLLNAPEGGLVTAFRDAWPAGISAAHSFNLGTTWEREHQIVALDAIPADGLSPNRPDPSFSLTHAGGADALCAVSGFSDAASGRVAGFLFHDGPPDKPGGLSGAFKTKKEFGVHLRWNAVPGAHYYLVFRGKPVRRGAVADANTNAGAAFDGKPYATAGQPRFVDTRVDTAMTYRYRVAAVLGSGRPIEGSGAVGEPSNVAVVGRKP